MPEQLVAEAYGIYCWEGPKMKATLLSAKKGRLVLTDQRLVFLSTGRWGALLALVGVTRSSKALDENALQNEGSLSLAIGGIQSCEVGKKRALVVTYRDESGTERAY